jgi:mRNA-degrading endonuclease RelE of RelBE toxin-antitoxin system
MMNSVSFKKSALKKTNLKLSNSKLNKLEKPTKILAINTLIPKFRFKNNKGETISIKDINLI